MDKYPIIQVYPFPEKETQIIHAVFEEGATLTMTYEEFKRSLSEVEINWDDQDLFDVLKAIARDYMEQG